MENYENDNITQDMEQKVETIPEVEKITREADGVYVPYAEQKSIDYKKMKPISKKDYRKNFTPEWFKKELKIGAIMMYVLSGANVLMTIRGSSTGILDAILTVGLTLGMHLGKSKGCAIGLLIYGIVNFIITSIYKGYPAGWMWLIIGFAIFYQFVKLDKEYKILYEQ